MRVNQCLLAAFESLELISKAIHNKNNIKERRWGEIQPFSIISATKILATPPTSGRVEGFGLFKPTFART